MPRWLAAALVALLIAGTLAACEVEGCVPTVTVAQDASIVVAPAVARSGVFTATLTAAGEPIEGRKITFTVDGGIFSGERTLGSDETSARGVAEFDLKQRPLKVVTTATKEEYRAAFAGDGRYCASSDTAVIDIARVS